MTTTRSPEAASRATVSTMSAVDVGGTRLPALGDQIGDERLRRQPAIFRDLAAEHRRDDHLVRALERLDEVALEHLQARRRGARLEDRPDAPGRVREAQRGDGFGDGGRMVREVVVDLDAVDRRRAARGGA